MTTHPTSAMGTTVADHQLNLNEDDLAAAADYLATDNPEDTVNAALKKVVEMRVRRRAMDRLVARGQAGQFDELMRSKQPR